MPLDDQYFYRNFNTVLTPQEEALFQTWAHNEGRRSGRNMLNDLYDYDLRGFWKNKEQIDSRGHGSDTYKKPNHPTFSTFSMYHGSPAPWGGQFEGGQWQQQPTGGWTYSPSTTMLQHTHSLDDLAGYMHDRESGNQLIMPPPSPPLTVNNGAPKDATQVNNWVQSFLSAPSAPPLDTAVTLPPNSKKTQ